MNDMNKISVNLVVLNGEKYISHCLESVLNQSIISNSRELEMELNILDNGSTDGTKKIIQDFVLRASDLGFTKINFTKSKVNLGMWPGQEELLRHSNSEYVVFLSVDVILDRDFIKNATAVMEAGKNIGALQAKIYQYDIGDHVKLEQKIIDTTGFLIHRSRRISNIGHGEKDTGQFNEPREIFGVEGAVPVFRREALESIRVSGEIADKDIFWYGEDLDVAWRVHLAGWKQVYEPSVIAWHDRGTTKSHTHGYWWQYIPRVNIRRQLPIRKRRLEWRNTRWTRVKNDYIINILKDLPYILWREVEVLGYAILFEPAVLKELPVFIKGLPKMLKKRRAILLSAKTSPSAIHGFFK
ncbi:MAG: hypothetical protein A2941_01185 [Candidatus Yanofskybacteria bacterium RIFCSPLOWO2_01_FULL_49_17]|uniref:Glycosyltransferase 2-like domain-containing protein n=1 Tax=Candidatus Yanofskybacteria bacterium RIFCSPLOWO2_01_FULL_49_17 TaxID=1802700 RepID=A0A1F8GQB8_9BACT|nr:MAG: hypothetical protein A2941_01185 [Candidatus Yanofskybacteria bacterium RIFCSPLOWO2_01_FULL_49_17]